MIESTTDYKNLPRLTKGDEDFRNKFISWDLGDLTFIDIQEYLKVKDVVLVPMASLEQHGPHLPLYTDTLTALEVSRRVSEHIGVLHTPPLWMGYSPQHMHEPGAGRGTTLDAASFITVLTASFLSTVTARISKWLIPYFVNSVMTQVP
jgi:creatinine amidohydrolase